MNKSKKHIVVFAGNECVAAKEKYYYGLAYEMGKLLAQAGYVTVTGGGPGLMDQVSRGAVENGGVTIGIKLSVAGRIHSTFLTTSELFEHLAPRQERLLSLGDAFIALPGGVGTFYEVFQVIALKRKLDIEESKPMILVDEFFDQFEQLMNHVIQHGFAPPTIQKLYILLKTPQDAVKILSASFA